MAQFDQMPDDLFHSNWPNLQLKLQKYLILVLVYAQESVYFESECVMSLFANSIIVNMEKTDQFLGMFFQMMNKVFSRML